MLHNVVLRTLDSDALKAKISLVKAFQIFIFIKIRGGASALNKHHRDFKIKS